MPNDCWNNIMIIRHGDDNSEELTELFDKEIKAKKPPDDCLIIDYKGNNGIKFKLWSAWRPDNEWLEGLIQKYPNCWIKNYWYEEGKITSSVRDRCAAARAAGCRIVYL